MKTCSVCGSDKLNDFDVDSVGGHYNLDWCEDCGSLHTDMSTSCPEKSMLHHQVLAFHKRFGQSIGDKPHVLDETTMRFRLSLIAEEFFELLEAAHPTLVEGRIFREARGAIKWIIKEAALGKLVDGNDIPMIDLPAFVDALADLAYVMEGTAISMGVNMTPVAAEVHRANISKIPALTGDRYGGVGAELPRPTKPEGWKPPDIEGELRKQGWKPHG